MRWARRGAGVAALFAGWLMVGCATEPLGEEGEERTGTVSQELREEWSFPAQASPSDVTLAFELESGVRAIGRADSVGLVATNHSPRDVVANVTLRLRGLGAKRVVDLGAISLSAGETHVVPWHPATSPIAPTGTSALVLAFVSYASAGGSMAIPSQPITLSFDKARAQAFLSPDDDLGVRLASLGRPYATHANSGPSSKALSTSDKAAVLSALGSQRGVLDGQIVDASPAVVAARIPSTEGASEEGDVVPFPGGLAPASSTPAFEEAGMSGGGAGASPSFEFDPPIFLGCLLPTHVNTKQGYFCANWDPQGFRDVGVSTSVVSEDFDGYGPAAYANAVAKSGSTVIWQGRLDGVGCTPVIEFCPSSASLEVSAASLQVPDRLIPGTYVWVFGTREFKIEPPVTYALTPSRTSTLTSPPYYTKLDFDVRSGLPSARVASVVSRILTMTDNGVGRNRLGAPFPQLVIDTEDGCRGTYTNPPNPPDFSYIDPVTGQTKYGEACADANTASFGQSLSLQQNAQGTYYVPTPWHTTQDIVTIGHELGHSAAFSMDGWAPSAGYDKPSAGDCSCDWVSFGNRTHCLQSRHALGTAEGEGFGHFYAARVMNDYGSGFDARFTYYKDYRYKYSCAEHGVCSENFAPPYPISISDPYAYSGATSNRGWVRTWCGTNAANTGSEYDWLTFLWAVNGKAPSTSRATMSDLFAIVRSSRSNFVWWNIKLQSDAHFGGSFDPRALLLTTRGTLTG